MPLTMRPTGLGSGIDKHLYCGGWDVGRIYETRGGPGSLRWFWSISLTPFATVATLEETEAQAL